VSGTLREHERRYHYCLMRICGGIILRARCLASSPDLLLNETSDWSIRVLFVLPDGNNLGDNLLQRVAMFVLFPGFHNDFLNNEGVLDGVVFI